MFETPEYRNKNEVFSYDCVLHDKTGTRIHATIGKTLIPKFKPILCEGKVYAFMNYVVAENSSRYKTTTSNYKLLIFNQTRICEVTDDNFPAHIYNFKSFEEIKKLKNTHEGQMFDVIGAIGSCYKPETREANGTSTKLVDIVLEDEQRRTLACTLWEEYANQLLEYLKKEPKEPVATIIQFCRPTNYKGELKVTNAYCATKIISDENEREIQEFIEKYARNAKQNSTMAATETTARIRFLDKKTDFDIPLKTISELQCDKKL